MNGRLELARNPYTRHVIQVCVTSWLHVQLRMLTCQGLIPPRLGSWRNVRGNASSSVYSMPSHTSDLLPADLCSCACRTTGKDPVLKIPGLSIPAGLTTDKLPIGLQLQSRSGAAQGTAASLMQASDALMANSILNCCKLITIVHYAQVPALYCGELSGIPSADETLTAPHLASPLVMQTLVSHFSKWSPGKCCASMLQQFLPMLHARPEWMLLLVQETTSTCWRWVRLLSRFWQPRQPLLWTFPVPAALPMSSCKR